MRHIFFTLIVLFSFISGILYAQYDEVSLLLIGGASLPTGDFAADIGVDPKITRRHGFDVGDNVGLAKPGLSLGAEFLSATGIKGLNWLVNATYIMNGVNTSTITSEFQNQLGDTVDISFEYTNWINIPIMSGLNYKYTLSPRTHLFGTLQVGINITRAALKKVTVGGITAEDKSYGFTADFGFGVGVGAVLWDKFILGIKYLALDTPTYPVTIILSEKIFPEIVTRERDLLGENRSVSMVLITLGYNIL